MTEARDSKANTNAPRILRLIDYFHPFKELDKEEKIFLSQKNPKVLEIPAGYAHGFMSLEPNTKITFYSDKTTKDSLEDDYRFDYNFWNPWNIKFR